MQSSIEARVLRLAHYISATGATVRDAASTFGVSKSTVHKDMTERLPCIDPALFAAVSKVLSVNKAERHIRGGIATHNKFAQMRSSHTNS